MMKWIFSGLIVLSIFFGITTGHLDAVSNAAISECGNAVTLVLKLMGSICLWSGLMKVAEESGLTDRISRLLRPFTRLIFRGLPETSPALPLISMNITANLLGLGNAATPLGLEAARGMAKKSPGVASDSLCMLVVCNTASIQLIPTTVATVRAAEGCASPFDILPAVWLASALSVSVGILMCKILAKLWPE